MLIIWQLGTSNFREGHVLPKQSPRGMYVLQIPVHLPTKTTKLIKRMLFI